jgi:hypothetical protein
MAPPPGGAIVPPEDAVRRITAHWGASAAVVQALLLHALAEKTLPDLAANAGRTAIAPRRTRPGAKFLGDAQG